MISNFIHFRREIHHIIKSGGPCLSIDNDCSYRDYALLQMTTVLITNNIRQPLLSVNFSVD